MITRNNYEEFFMLYVDNELSAADRQIVESFVGDNADLQAELNLLMQCRLDPEGNAFPNKSSLLRSVVDEESLYLYIDGELDGEARRVVERQAQEDEVIGRELMLLRQTVSEPDAGILFTKKETLYKKEGERRIAIMAPMFRVAAALLLLLASLAVLYVMKKKEGPATAGGNGKKTEPATALSQGAREAQGARDAREARNTRGATGDRVIPGGLETTGDRKTLEDRALPGRQGKNVARTVTRTPAPPLYSSTSRKERSKERHDGSPLQVPGVSMKKDEDNKDRGLASNEPRSNPVELAKPLNAGTEKTIGDGMEAALKKGNSVMAVASIGADRTGRPLPGPAVDAGAVKGGTFATDALLREGTAETGSEDIADEPDDGDAAPSKKRRLRGVLRTVSRVFERTTSQSDGDRPGILIGNLQIARKQ